MTPRPNFQPQIGHRKVRLGERTLIMDALNVTPDSFSDGGLYLDPARAIERGLELVRQGADWIDVGGESTRPGSQPVSAQEELRRVLPVMRSR
jgi:dihydropteroate synthase